jgi:hypothetical protein
VIRSAARRLVRNAKLDKLTGTWASRVLRFSQWCCWTFGGTWRSVVGQERRDVSSRRDARPPLSLKTSGSTQPATQNLNLYYWEFVRSEGNTAVLLKIQYIGMCHFVIGQIISNGFNPFWSYVRPHLTWFSCSAPMSEDALHFFVASVRPLRCRSLSDAFPHVVRILANRWHMSYSFCFSAGQVF